MDLGWVIWKDFQLEISNGAWLGNLEGFLVGNGDGEALGHSNEVLVGWSEKGCRSVHQMSRGQGICGLGVWCAWWAAGCSEVSKPRLLALVHRDAHTEG